MEMTRVQAIKAYFGDKVPVTNAEVMALRGQDASGQSYLAVLGDGALAVLGATRKVEAA